MRICNAKINGKTIPVQYYEPGRGRTVSNEINLGDLGELGKNLLGSAGIGLGALGIAPLVAAGWLGTAALLGGASYIGVKLYKGVEEVVGPPGNFIEGLGRSIPFLAGSVLSNYIGKQALPKKYIKYRWPVAAGLAGFGIYQIARGVASAKDYGDVAASKSGTQRPPVNTVQSKQWDQFKEDIQIVKVTEIITPEVVSFEVIIRNNANADRQVRLTLSKIAEVAGQYGKGIPIPIGPSYSKKAPWYSALSPIWMVYNLSMREVPVVVNIKASATKRVTMSFKDVQKLIDEPGKLNVRVSLFSVTDLALKNPFTASEIIRIET